MADPVLIKSIAGLWSSPNPFSKVPEGALTIADEVAIRANGMLEPRRGFDYRNLFGGVASRALAYGPKTIALLVNDAPAVFDVPALNLVFNSDLAGPVLAPYSSDARTAVQTAIANNEIVWTGRNGPVALSVPATNPDASVAVRFAGAPRATAPIVTLVAASGNATMATGKRRTYRVTLAFYDNAGNFLESAPSEPVYIENSSGGAQTPQLTLRMPLATEVLNIQLTDPPFPFFRIWRGLETAIGVPSNDEMFLIREFVPPSVTLDPTNSAFIDPNVTYTVNDVSLDALLNVPLYTNPQTGDGLGVLSANRRPPVSAAIAYFSGRMYYGRCSYQQQLALQIIGTGTGGVAVGDIIAVDGITYTAGASEVLSARTFACPTTAGVVAQNIETCAKSLIECIRFAYGNNAGVGYSRSINRQLYAYYASSDVSDFGRIILERPLPFANGDDPGISFAVTTASAGVRFPNGSTSSTDDYSQGGVSWSKPNQPEAVPDINFQIVGDEAKSVLGFSVHRDCMIVYKEDGAFICRDDGSQAGPSFDLLDTGVICIAPQSIAVVSNLAYLLATRGVLQVSEQGTQLMSVPIATDLLKLYEQSQNALATAYGFGSEATRQYVLGLPAGPNETACSQQYVLRVPEDDSPFPKWTRWLLPGTTSGCALPSGQIVFTFSAPSLPIGQNQGLLIERFGNGCSMDYFDGYLSTSQNAPGAGTVATVSLAGDLRALIGTGDLLFYGPGGVGNRSYLPRVIGVSYSSGTNQTTVTLDQAIPWSGGTFIVYPSIRARWRFAPITAGEPTAEKQWGAVQGFFTYFDGDWLDFQVDAEGANISASSQVFADPRQTNLGGELALSFPGSILADPSPAAALNTIRWLRSCKDVLLRLDPGVKEARSMRLGVEMTFAQSQSRFQFASASAAVVEINETGVR